MAMHEHLSKNSPTAAKAALTLLGALAATAIVAAPTHVCRTPPSQPPFCDASGLICADLARECDIDFDGLPANGYEHTALIFSNKGSDESEPFFGEDRSCYQGENFDPNGTEPDTVVNEYGALEFALVLPENYTSGSFPLYVALAGGGAGWVDVDASQLPDSWAPDVSNPNNWVWEQGFYRGKRPRSQGEWTRQFKILPRVIDEDGLISRLRETPGGNWAILVPSSCSNDNFNGRDELADAGPLFAEAAATRIGFDSVVEAIQIVDEQYGIDHFYVGGTSAGGSGAFMLAARLPTEKPALATKLRGAVVDAIAMESNLWADLFNEANQNGGLRDVNTDGTCTNFPATVSCDSTSEPMDDLLVKIGLTDHSASEDIGNGMSIPILHIWNERDSQFCFDKCYSDDFLHGAMARAIDDRKVGGIDERFDFSENLEICVGSCLAGTEVVECVKHGSLGAGTELNDPAVDGVVDCAAAWIAEVDRIIDQGLSETAYNTPSECLQQVRVVSAVPPVLCSAPAVLSDNYD